MKWYILILFIFSIFFLTLLSKATVFCEYTTTTNCHACPEVSKILYDIYNSHNYPFYYVSLITDKNSGADKRAKEYNVYGYPTAFMDGGYKVIFGKHPKENYINAIEKCMQRNTKNVFIKINTRWEKDGLKISVNVSNDEVAYKGNLRVYVVEPISKYKDYKGNNYHYAFIGYAINKNISIVKGKMSYASLWRTNITDNIMIIGVLFDADSITKYSDPPANKHPFRAYFVDAVDAVKPKKDTPPSLTLIKKPKSVTGYRNVTFTWYGEDDGGNVLYSYKLDGYENWHNWSNKKIANYNLKDGYYKFILRGIDNIGQITKILYSFRVDTSQPYIVYTYPPKNAVNFPSYKDIVIKFSHAMNKKTVKIKFIPDASYSLHWKNDTELYITSSLKYETRYTLEIEGERLSGQKMQTYSFSFETAPADLSKPYVIFTNPFYGEYHNSIKIKFSKPMNKIILKGILIEPQLPFLYTWGDNDSLLIIKLLKIYTGTYNVTITEYMQDKYGNSAKPFNFQFSITKPRVVFFSGENTTLLLHENIDIKFSHPMNKTSVEKNIKIIPKCHYNIEWNGNKSIIIKGEWKSGMKYHLSITGARDARGISMANYSAYFTVSNALVPMNSSNKNMPSFSITSSIFAIFLILWKKSWRRK